MSFLGVRSERRYIPPDVRKSVNPTASSAIPAAHRRFLEELLRDEIEALRRRFGLSWARPEESAASPVEMAR
jgi:hypothetical protein